MDYEEITELIGGSLTASFLDALGLDYLPEVDHVTYWDHNQTYNYGY